MGWFSKANGGVERRLKTAETLARLDETCKNIEHSFDVHCEEGRESSKLLLERTTTCPEATHISQQNGKLDDLTESVSEIKGAFGVWAKIITIIFGAILSGVIAIVIKFYLHH